MSALTTALTTIRRSPYQSLASILMTSVTFFVAYIFALFVFVSSTTLQYFETQPQVIGFFELGASQEDIEAVAAEITQQSFVAEVKTISQNQALELYKEENKQDPLLLELVTADILPASIEVSGKSISSLQEIKTKLEENPLIEDIIFQEDIISNLQFWINTTRQIGIATMAILGTLSLLVIWIVIAMKASVQKKTIAIMRMLGASKWYIKAPFVIEGGLYGLTGASFGWLGVLAMVLYLMPMLEKVFAHMQIFPIAIEAYILSLLAGMVLGTTLGIIISSAVVSRFVKK